VLKNRSVPGKKLKPNTITGKQVRESRLAKVRRAALADRATTSDQAAVADRALTAEALGGAAPADFERTGRLLRFAVRMQNTDPEQTLFQAGPFTVKASCVLSGGGVQNVFRVWAETTENDAAAGRHNIAGDSAAEPDFDVGEDFVVSEAQEGGTPPNPSGVFRIDASLFSPSGTHVLMEVGQGGRLFSANASERVHCTFAGFAVVS